MQRRTHAAELETPIRLPEGTAVCTAKNLEMT
jgi:hypothetical protein